MQSFAIGTTPWQHWDEFEDFSFAKVVKGNFFPFFLTQKNVVYLKLCL